MRHRCNSFRDLKVLNEPCRPVAYSLTDKGRKLAVLVRELENL